MTVTNNLAMEFVVTTRDKVSDALHKALPRFKESYAWSAPVSLAATVWLTILTADFKGILWFTPDAISGGFWVLGVLSTCWAAKSLYSRARHSYGHQDVVNAIVGTHDASAARIVPGSILNDDLQGQ